MARREEDIGDWLEDGASGDGLSLAGWGIGAITAFVLAFASWQYAPDRPMGDLARFDAGAPDPSEITGSIGERTATQASRTVGGSRIAPMPLDGNETLATSRDIERLRGEVRDIQRRLTQMGMSGDGMSRRVDKMEERLSLMATAADPAQRGAAGEPPRSTDSIARPMIGDAAPKAADPALAEKTAAERLVERLPMPIPRPSFDPPAAPPPSDEADGPATTGAVPRPSPITALPEIQGSRPPKPVEPAAKPEPVARVEGLPKPSATPAPEPAPKPEPAKSEAAPKGARGPIAVPPPQTAAEPTAPAAPAQTLASVAPPRPATPPAPAEGAPVAPQLASAMSQASAPPPGGGPAGIDLGGYRTLASLRRSWADMTIRYGDLSKGLEPLARLRETDSGMEARLLAGPFADPTDAAKACLKLKAAGANCTVTNYGGQPIGGMH